MADDVARLVIAVDTKGTKTAAKEVDTVTKSVKGLGTTTKTAVKTQNSFTTATGKFRTTLPSLASGVYLAQQAYAMYAGAVSELTEAYEEQYSAEIKLQTILTSTSNAIGKTYDEVYELAQAWQAQTGTNDAVVLQASAIASTFTQISEEVFPDMIEQALNMSAIFGQDLKQSMIQLGTATNDPVKGLGRLRRIGISFSTEQREMIKGLVEAGDILGAQQEIMRELEIEIGGVARAMGETSLGAIKKYQTAWKNLKEELGEGVTTLRAELIETLGLTGKLEELTARLAGNNAGNKFKLLIDSGAINGDIRSMETSAQEITDAYNGYDTQITRILNTLDKEEKRVFKDTAYIKALKEEKAEYYEYMDALQAFSVRYKKFQDELKAGMDEIEILPTVSKDALAWLTELKRIEAQKSKILGLDEIAAKYDAQKFSREQQYRSLVDKGVELGFKRVTIEALINKYSGELEAHLKEQEKTERALLALTKQRSDIDLYGSEEQQKAQDYQVYLEGLMEAYGRGSVSIDQATEALTAFKLAQDDQEQPEDLMSFTEALETQLGSARTEAERLNDVILTLADSLLSLGTGIVSESLESIGSALAGNNQAAAEWGQTMVSLVASTIQALGPQLLLAGAVELAKGNPAGWGLVAAGTAMSIGAGYLNEAMGTESSGSSSSSITSSSNINEDEISFANNSRSTSPTISNNIINNTNAVVSSKSSVDSNGQIIMDTVVNTAVKATANKYALTTSGTNVR